MTMERRCVKASKPYFPLEGKGCEFWFFGGGLERGRERTRDYL